MSAVFEAVHHDRKTKKSGWTQRAKGTKRTHLSGKEPSYTSCTLLRIAVVVSSLAVYGEHTLRTPLLISTPTHIFRKLPTSHSHLSWTPYG